MTFHISEIFGAGLSHRGVEPKAQYPTIQGEGAAAGRATIFVRFFGCTLRCEGFSQPNPADRSTYQPIMQGIDPKSIKRVQDFKTPEFGCDTRYAIDPKFKHLVIKYDTAEELYNDAIVPLLYKMDDGTPSWKHPVTGNMIDLCFTGGEPMLHQQQMVDLCEYILDNGDSGVTFTIETNATKSVDSLGVLSDYYESCHVIMNVSPKLLTVAGEPDKTAWHPGIICQYSNIFNGTLKFVVNDTAAAWDELDRKVKELRLLQVNYPIYVMPAGALYHQQADQAYLRKIAERALKEGYYVSPRLHVNIWDGVVGC